MKNEEILRRINFLKEAITERLVKKALYTKEESFKELQRLKELSIANTGNTGKADMSAAIKAEELRGKLTDLYVDHSDIEIKEFSEEAEYL